MAIAGENITIASAARAVASLGRCALPRPIVVDHPDEYVAALNPFLLPLNPTLDVDHDQAKHVFDVIERFEGPLDKEHIAELAAKKKISELPEPFRIAAPCPIPYHISFFVLKNEDGTMKVLKHIELSEKRKIGFLKSLCYGDPHVISWGGLGAWPKTSVKVLQYFLDNVGGSHAAPAWWTRPILSCGDRCLPTRISCLSSTWSGCPYRTGRFTT